MEKETESREIFSEEELLGLGAKKMPGDRFVGYLVLERYGERHIYEPIRGSNNYALRNIINIKTGELVSHETHSKQFPL